MRLLAIWVLFTLAVFAAGNELSEWVSNTLQVPKKGSTKWTIIVTTGHLGKDPELAEAMKSEILRLLSQVGAPEDEVRVRGAEMELWYDSGFHPIDDVTNQFPTAPAPHSKGGRDIEKVLSTAAEEASGPILVFSPGGSLLPVDGKGTLTGGDGTVEGFLPPVRRSFLLITNSGARSIQITVLTKDGWFTGEQDRKPVPALVNNSTGDISARRRDRRKVGASQSTNWTPMAVGASLLLGAAIGVFFARKAQSYPAVSQPESSSEQDLSQLQEYVKQLQKRLDFAAQELEESVSRATNQDQVEQLELRREIAKQTQLLSNWDQLAIGYLDGIDRALKTEGLSEVEIKTWTRTRRHFVDRIQEMGLDEIRPEIGKEPSLGFHRIDHYTAPTPEVQVGQVSTIVSSGFRRGDYVIRQALVAVAGERS